MPAKRRTYSKKRRRVSKPAPKKRKKRTVKSTPNIDKFATDLTHFMCPHDKSPAIRIPDSSLSNSLKMILETTGTFQPAPVNDTDNLRDGSGSLAFFPGHLRQCKVEYTVANLPGAYEISTIVGGTGVNSQSYDTIVDNCESYRVVSATVKIQFIGESDENGGELVIKKFDPDNDTITNATATDSGVPNDFNERCKKTEYIPAKHGAFITLNMSQAHRTETFEDPNFQNTRSMEAVVIFFSGCNASVAQQWRWTLIQNVELLPKKNTLLHEMSIPPPPPMPVFEHAYNLLMKDVTEANLDIVPAKAEHTVRQAVYTLAKKSIKDACSQGGYGLPKFIENH